MHAYRDYILRKAKAVRTLPGNQFRSVTVTVEFRTADWTSCFKRFGKGTFKGEF